MKYLTETLPDRGTLRLAAAVVCRGVPTPDSPVPPFDGAPPGDEGMVSHFIGGEQPVWEAALRADPVVRAFLDDDRNG